MSSYKCEKCIHEEACDQAKYDDYFGECKLYKDKSLCVELPVKLGQICYALHPYRNEVEECRVSSLTQKADGSWKIRLTHSLYKGVFEITLDKIGKTVFLTRELAEGALKNEQEKL